MFMLIPILAVSLNAAEIYITVVLDRQAAGCCGGLVQPFTMKREQSESATAAAAQLQVPASESG